MSTIRGTSGGNSTKGNGQGGSKFLPGGGKGGNKGQAPVEGKQTASQTNRSMHTNQSHMGGSKGR